MHRHTLALAILALALATGVPPAAAQAPTNSGVQAPGQAPAPALGQPGGPTLAQASNATAAPAQTERIDNNTVLVSAEYDEETGQAVVTLESDILQDVVVTDASGLLQGGQVAKRTVTLVPDKQATIRLDSTKADGYVVVGISTRETLYGKQIQTSADLFGGAATWDTVQAGALGGGFGVLVLTAALAWRMRRGGRKKERRIA